jgi:1-phosphofructokinase
MIVTVTPSPAIDWTVTLDSFALDSVNRASGSVREPSGKGVNVSVALHRAGVPTHAIVPAGGDSGRFLAGAIAAHGIPLTLIDTCAEIRTNITLVIPGHPGTKINEPGSPLSADVLDRLFDAVLENATGAEALLTCGSLPAGVPPTFHRDIVRLARGVGAYSVVDASGDALRLALDAGPDLVKPNVHELAELTGGPIGTLGDVVAAAQALRERGAGAVLASLGGDGVVYVDEAGALFARADGLPVINTVGAGDALLAGFMGGDRDRKTRLATAVLWASSAVAEPSTLFTVRPEFAGAIFVSATIDTNARLDEPSKHLARA